MKNLFVLLLILVSSISCSKSPGKTAAKLKLNLSGIVNISSGIGSGGAILFGRNDLGNIFGKKLIGNEENLDLPNGNWVFYALMWDSAAGATAMNGKVHCAKVAQQLSGADTSISLNLDNANCADPEFSEGRVYTSAVSGHKRFADVFVEECDMANSQSPFSCGLGNQGSGTSYRFKFQSFRKSPASPLVFEGEPIYSDCRQVNAVPSLHTSAFPINFPSGSLVTPFIVTIESFLSSANCDANDPKGVFELTLNQGLKTQNPIDHKVLFSTSMGTPDANDFLSTTEENKKKCEEELLGTWGSGCSFVPLTVTRFAPGTLLKTQSVATPAIKHLFQIPKSFLCDRYLNSSAQIGSHPFAGGDGSGLRPYKICNEWQINQIGEVSSPINFSTLNYKLMNDLDMNKTDFGAYARPTCVGVVDSLVKEHHNLNPLDKLSNGSCTSVYSTVGFTGKFDGNFKTISNARIDAKTVTHVGFTRQMGGGSVVKNLNFNFLEVSGDSNIGGVAGTVFGGDALIRNIRLERSRVEAEGQNGSGANYVGAVAGAVNGSGAKIISAQVINSHVRGRDNVGGIAGRLLGGIAFSKFRGEIETHDSNGFYSGGLVGFAATSAIINDSITEGSISSAAQNIAGIAGSNSGSINRVYSTMTIIPNNMNNGASKRVAGIIAEFSSGSLADSYFDGSIYGLASISPTPISGGVIAYLGSASSSNCFSSLTSITAGGNCTSISTATLRNGSLSISNTSFKQQAGSIPRFLWETRECLDPINQQGLPAQVTNQTRGSATNPLVICTSAQLSSLSGRSSAEFYRLAEDINLADWNDSSLINSFSGNLNGDDKIIYGLNVSPADSAIEAKGMIKTLSSTAKVKRLRLYGNRIVSSAAVNASSAGGLAGENFGELRNIIVRGFNLDGGVKVGIIAGYNDGIISDSDLNDTEIKGSASVGAVAGYADVHSSIQRLDVQTRISPSGGSGATEFGGVAGVNKGLIDQTRFGGEIVFNGPTTAANGLRAGGLVGYNSGTLSNSYVENWSTLRVRDINKAGGLVGENDGNINRSFNLGKVLYNNNGSIASAGSLHPLVSINTSGTVSGDNYFLENKIGSVLGSETITTCTGAGPFTATVQGSAPFYLSSSAIAGNTSADFFSTTNGGGGSLSTMTPITSIGSPNNFTFSSSECVFSFVEFYRGLVISPSGSKTIAEMGNINTFCGGFSGSLGNEVCTSGYDIVGEDKANGTRYGEKRMIEYYKSLMYNTPTPADAPIWELDHDGNPSLMQLEHY